MKKYYYLHKYSVSAKKKQLENLYFDISDLSPAVPFRLTQPLYSHFFGVSVKDILFLTGIPDGIPVKSAKIKYACATNHSSRRRALFNLLFSQPSRRGPQSSLRSPSVLREPLPPLLQPGSYPPLPAVRFEEWASSGGHRSPTGHGLQPPPKPPSPGCHHR